MNWFIGFRRLGLLLSVFYWIFVVREALIRASTGFWPDGQDPVAFLVRAFFFYLLWYGVLWTLSGFFLWPRGRY